MKKLLVLSLGLATACHTSQNTGSEVAKNAPKVVEYIPTPFAESIIESDLKEHLYTYASDEFEGRETGQPGQKKAIEYLKSEYESIGVPAAQSDGDYFQEVPLEISQVPSGSMNINGKEYVLGEHFLTFAKAEGTFDNIIYAAYGIETDNYSDYEGLDVSDKLVLIKSGEPMNADGTYTLSGSIVKSSWSNMSEALGKKVEIALNKGAKGVLYYDEGNFARFNNRFQYMKTNDSGRMQLAADDNGSFFNFIIDNTLAHIILPQIDTDSESRELSVPIAINIKSENKKIESENVVAFIKGSVKPDEYLVISSHLDHIGITADGEINNGADDDGSGTVAVLEIAEAFQKAVEAGQRPKRSIVFLHVTGEEKGLLGSRYYTDIDPIFPLEKTVANLNIDMIGRIDPKRTGERNYIYLIGSDKLSTDLHQISESVNDEHTLIELDYSFNDENDPNRFYYRSDHYNFAKNNIPIIFYFNGTHEDYHRPGDTPDKINYDLLENRTRLIFYTAWEIANRDERLMVDKIPAK
ncbi:M28 family peptidase [Pareuzebyella sediminis]|uniref:M28 family peptidase n=1 Tax=Pareuzebyella sediminis TaxID=2607998 RepID=UPI0011EFCCD7|nr:M28 family peptidase [Pareuzebyella sediminis]